MLVTISFIFLLFLLELEEEEAKPEEGSNAKVESSAIARKETKEKPEGSEVS